MYQWFLWRVIGKPLLNHQTTNPKAPIRGKLTIGRKLKSVPRLAHLSPSAAGAVASSRSLASLASACNTAVCDSRMVSQPLADVKHRTGRSIGPKKSGRRGAGKCFSQATRGETRQTPVGHEEGEKLRWGIVPIHIWKEPACDRFNSSNKEVPHIYASVPVVLPQKSVCASARLGDSSGRVKEGFDLLLLRE